MDLNRARKKKDTSFMSRAFVQNRLTDLCSIEHQYTVRHMPWQPTVLRVVAARCLL